MRRRGALAYEAPTDPDDELARRNLYLEPGEALPGLLTRCAAGSWKCGPLTG